MKTFTFFDAKTIFCLAFIIFSKINLIAQIPQYESGLLWVTISDSSAKPISVNDKSTSHQQLNQLLNNFNVISYTQALPFAKNPQLRDVYEIKCDCDEQQLMDQLTSNYSNLFSYIEKRSKPILLYDPADYMWYLTTQDPTGWLWHLKKIQADLAWDITKGNPNLKIAVVDNGVDPNHPDLIGKIDPPYDFYTGNPFVIDDHGTFVSTILAGETVDQGQIPNGQIASVGYNSKIMFSYYGYGTTACLYASNVLGAKILSISWYSGCSSTPNDLLIEQEILDNGTAIIKAAGNGNVNCGGGRLYPFSGLEDNRTIIVSSTDKDDNHQNINPGGNTHSHYPEVDVCAPGYCIMGGTSTDGGTNTWPYYGCGMGTSFATPIVAGTVALMLSVNPCLEPQDIQYILKNTADPITDEANYSGLVGSGRINAYNAVSMALALTEPDLYVRDSPEDIGSEPNVETANAMGVNFWSSSDIWIRQTNDGLINQFSEPIEYTASIPNYIYVRVKNRGCASETANLRLYWASAGTGLGWPIDWVNNNNTYPGCTAAIYGNEITPSTSITVPGQSEQIYVIPWQPNNPDNYSCFTDPFHFCLLARIETSPLSPYGMTFPEGTSVWANTKDNNNIAWKNIIINNDIPGMVRPFGTSIIRNTVEKTTFIKLNFISRPDDIGQDLSKFKSIRLFFTKDFIRRWAEGGKRGKDVVLINDSVIEVTSSNATMEHIFLRYNEIGSVSLSLLPKKEPVLSNENYFNFDIVQYSEEGKVPQGGITYQIKKGILGNDCYTSATTLSGVITNNQTFSDSILVTGNILVPNGITLKFEKAIVLIDENIRIRVMPGGKLIINSSELISSCIEKKWAGIEVKGNPVFLNPLSITNSVIIGSDFPINLDKSKDILISGSAFIGDNIGIAIMMNKMKDFLISGNTFVNYEIGIRTTNTCAADVKSGIEKNIFFNVKTAIDFSNDNHSKLDIKCNRFSYTDYAILSNQTLLKDQGQLDEGAGNEFISNSTLANNKLKHTNGNSPNYYYDPSQPITSGMNVTTIASITDCICYSYSFDTSSTANSQRMAPAVPIQKSISKKVIDIYSVPNPNSGQASIYYSLGEENLGEIVIMDIFGKVIDRITVINESNKVDVDYSRYASGIYLISLTNSKGETINKKMIIAK